MENILSLIISLVAVGISFFALGWNIYRDIILKPRLRVGLYIGNLIHNGKDGQQVVVLTNTKRGKPSHLFIGLSVVNYGPGPIICNGVMIRKTSLIRRLTRRVQVGFTVPDLHHPLCSKLPIKLDVGEEAAITFPYNEKGFLACKPTDVGIKDSYGRIHWANRNSIRKSTKIYLEDFSPLDFPKAT